MPVTYLEVWIDNGCLWYTWVLISASDVCDTVGCLLHSLVRVRRLCVKPNISVKPHLGNRGRRAAVGMLALADFYIKSNCANKSEVRECECHSRLAGWLNLWECVCHSRLAGSLWLNFRECACHSIQSRSLATILSVFP